MYVSTSRKVLVILFLTGLVVAPVLAQEPGGFGETFDDPALPGWEHNESASVAEGMLRLSPGGFAAHPGEWGDLALRMALQYVSGEGALVIAYHTSEVGTHVVVLDHEQVMFQRHTHDQVNDLGATPQPIPLPADLFHLELVTIGEQHVVSINGQPIASTSDFELLPDGGIAFEVVGSLTIEIDSLELFPGNEMP